MEESKLDKVIREKFQERSLETSVSSWERMENMLDTSERKSKKKMFFFVGIAASIAIIFSVFLKMNTNQIEEIPILPVKNQIIVTAPKKDINTENKTEREVNAIIEKKKNQNHTEVVIAQKLINSKKKINKRVDTGLEKPSKIIEQTFEVKNSDESFASIASDTPVELKNLDKIIKPVSSDKRRIQVNSDDLLYAVTHSPKEVKEYYANLELNRNDVLDSIKFQLKRTNLKINPELILAEVERSIEDDEYQGNFKDNLGRRISTIIVAVANRNK